MNTYYTLYDDIQMEYLIKSQWLLKHQQRSRGLKKNLNISISYLSSKEVNTETFCWGVHLGSNGRYGIYADIHMQESITYQINE